MVVRFAHSPHHRPRRTGCRERSRDADPPATTLSGERLDATGGSVTHVDRHGDAPRHPRVVDEQPEWPCRAWPASSPSTCGSVAPDPTGVCCGSCCRRTSCRKGEPVRGAAEAIGERHRDVTAGCSASDSASVSRRVIVNGRADDVRRGRRRHAHEALPALAISAAAIGRSLIDADNLRRPRRPVPPGDRNASKPLP